MNYFEYLGIKIYLGVFKPIPWILWTGNEFWKDVPNYEGKYQVSTNGRVKNILKGNILKDFDRASPNTPQSGYRTVQLARRENGRRFINFSVHSLVMLTFIGKRPIDKNTIHHKDFKKANNKYYNLEYCTQGYNRKQDFISGNMSYKGEKNNMVKITAQIALKIVELRKSGLKNREVGDMFGLSISGVSSVYTGHTWSHITGISNKRV